MIVSYFDASALVPLLIAESSTRTCREVWLRSEHRISSVIVKAEVAAALAKAHRMNRIDKSARDAALGAATRLWSACDMLVVSGTVADAAADVAVRHQLRGYDAVHVATSLLVAEDALGVSGDAAMIAVWRSLGIATADVTAGSHPAG